MPSKCACYRLATRRECVELRYGRNDEGYECECVCHDEQEALDDENFELTVRRIHDRMAAAGYPMEPWSHRKQGAGDAE